MDNEIIDNIPADRTVTSKRIVVDFHVNIGVKRAQLLLADINARIARIF